LRGYRVAGGSSTCADFAPYGNIDFQSVRPAPNAFGAES